MEDDSQDIYLKGLISRFLKAQSDVEHYKAVIEDSKEKLNTAGNLTHSYKAALRAEGIDPDNIPLELIEREGASFSILPQTKVKPPQLLLTPPNNNGNSAVTEEVDTPINVTHAVFTLMKSAGNQGNTPDELYEMNLKAGYNLTRLDISSTLSRRMSKGHVKKLEGGRYILTEKGLSFNNFRKKGSTWRKRSQAIVNEAFAQTEDIRGG